MSNGLVTVVGATGTQGRAIAKLLLKQGWRVRGICRNVGNDQAHALRALGAELVSADLDDRNAVNDAIKNSDAVVSIIASLQNRHDIGQATQGIHVAEAAALAEVKHFIYSAVLNPTPGIMGQGSKLAIIERIHELGLPATILHPCFFMDNLLTHFPVQVQNGAAVVALPFPPETTLQLIAVGDIARATGTVLDAPGTYIGKCLDLIGDQKTFQQMVDTIASVTGKPAVAATISLDALAQGWPQGIPMLKLLTRGGQHGDAAMLGKLVGKPTDFTAWVRENLLPRLGA